jgi:hypothetical protein
VNRRRFVRLGAALGATAPLLSWGAGSARAAAERAASRLGRGGFRCDVAIIGGGLGGIAAALSALQSGLKVVLTEETDWIGGQLTSQAVPPDEHRWIETHGCTKTYRQLRQGIRDYYRLHYPLTDAAKARADLNPGNGSVSALCHEPRVALAVLEALLAPYVPDGRLVILREHRPVSAVAGADRVQQVTVRNLRTGRDVALEAPWFIDATELGDLLPLTGTEFVTGAEAGTGELHASARPGPANQQSFVACFIIDHVAGEEHVIDPPRDWAFWKHHVPNLTPAWPGRLLDLTHFQPQRRVPVTLGFNPEGDTPGVPLNLWRYRRIAAKANFQPRTYHGDVSLINWPQNDYMLGNLVGVSEAEAQKHVTSAKQLSLSLLYWLQTGVPRPEGGQGWPGLRLRKDLVGTEDGLAKSVYVREARRIRARFTVLEQHVGLAMRAQATGVKEAEAKAAEFADTVGIGSYPIDLHPSSAGDNYIDFPTAPFQIPLGALLPVRMKNLLPACKNIGTTHVTNGCYRLHPVEWNIGEAAGIAVALAARKKLGTSEALAKRDTVSELQADLVKLGVELAWKA